MMRTVVVRGLVLAAAVLALAGAGHAWQSGGTKAGQFDPTKKGVWRFLDDDLYAIRTQGAKAYADGDFKGAAKHYLDYLYRNGGDVIVIYNLARCYARMGDAETAVNVLSRAARRGFVHPELLEADKEFEAVRDSRVFRNYLKTLGGIAGTLGQEIPVSGPRINLTRVRLPAKYDPAGSYPLVVGLHGNGSNSDDIMLSLTAEAFPGMICAAPNGAYARTDLRALPGERLSWFLPDADRSLWPTMDPLTSEYIHNVIAEVSARYRVSHVILFGFSQGVSAAYLTALRYPDRVAGVIAFAGGFPRTSFSPEQIKAGNRIRVMIAHGTKDAQVGRESSERARDLLREQGYRVQFETFEGGHALPPDMMRSAGRWIRSWLSDTPGRAPEPPR